MTADPSALRREAARLRRAAMDAIRLGRGWRRRPMTASQYLALVQARPEYQEALRLTAEARARAQEEAAALAARPKARWADLCAIPEWDGSAARALEEGGGDV